MITDDEIAEYEGPERRKRFMATEAWLDCYGKPGMAACIRVALQHKPEPTDG